MGTTKATCGPCSCLAAPSPCVHQRPIGDICFAACMVALELTPVQFLEKKAKNLGINANLRFEPGATAGRGEDGLGCSCSARLEYKEKCKRGNRSSKRFFLQESSLSSGSFPASLAGVIPKGWHFLFLGFSAPVLFNDT